MTVETRAQSMTELNEVDWNKDDELDVPKRKNSIIYNCVCLASLSLIFFFVLVPFNIPAPVQTHIMEDLSYTMVEFSQLMSISAWASAFCFLGGYYADRVSCLNIALYTFLLIWCFGNILFVVGILIEKYSITIMGRIFNGFGGDCILVLLSSYILHWFSEGKLNLAFALVSCFGLLEPAFTFMICNPLYEFITNHFNGNSKQMTLAQTILIITGLASIIVLGNSIMIATIYRKTSSKLNEKKDLRLMSSMVGSIKVLFNFKPVYWTLIISIACIYAVMFNFLSFFMDFYTTTYNMSIDDSNTVISIYSVVMFITSPFIGLLIDKTGGNIYYLVISFIGSAASHGVLTFTDIKPIIPIISLSISLSIFISCNSQPISKVVNSYQVATAYGLSNSFTNFAIGFAYMAAGYIIDTFGYKGFEIFLLLILSGGLFSCIITIILIEGVNRKITSTNNLNINNEMENDIQ